MTEPHTPSPYEVETHSGRFIDCSNPRADLIDLDDIAHALGNICRYGGHSDVHYSVAEHAVFVSKRLERKGQPWYIVFGGLHHDDTEYMLGDIPRPTKGLLRSLGSAYDDLSALMDAAICSYLNTLSPLLRITPALFHNPIVKDSDNFSLFVEARHLLPSRGINWSGSQLDDWGVRQDGLPQRIVTPDYWRGGLPGPEAKQLFLDRHHEIMEKIG
jgi:5'-deoxynucleotidase YfbR-like HD superfamily hydrolase